CSGCPELGQRRICTGCRLQADAVRAYETQATNLLLASGYNPCIPAPRVRRPSHGAGNFQNYLGKSVVRQEKVTLETKLKSGIIDGN
ncbi:MAG: hypothetical protein ACYS29_06300, partial [Planctomycetota bacterium]